MPLVKLRFRKPSKRERKSPPTWSQSGSSLLASLAIDCENMGSAISAPINTKPRVIVARFMTQSDPKRVYTSDGSCSPVLARQADQLLRSFSVDEIQRATDF